MGQYVSNIVSDYCPESIANVYNQIGQKRKRNISEDEDALLLEKSLHEPKKIKLTCTTEYIYRALFLEGGDYDITVNILDKEWKLHKIYLQQSPYFASMFSGSWNESQKSYITIEVADSKITIDALKVVLGSLYFDEPSIEPSNAVSILAAATLFQMDGLIEQCINVMVDNISPLTSMEYYEASLQYGSKRVNAAVKEWFCINLMTFYPKHTRRLRAMDIDLMAQLVDHDDLIVIPAEFSLYLLLRFWIFLKFNPTWDYTNDQDLTAVKDFFKNRTDNKTPFLLTSEGRQFIQVFQHIRIGNLLLHMDDMNVVIDENVIPKSWIFPQVLSSYQNVLKVFQGLDKGPTAEFPPEIFLKECLRCGRTLTNTDPHTWRWNLFNFGLYLNWIVIDNAVKVQRIRKSDDFLPFPQSNFRHFIVRVKVLTLNKNRQIKKSVCSGIMPGSLFKNGEITVVELDKDMEYPLIISISIMFATPEKKLEITTDESTSEEKQ